MSAAAGQAVARLGLGDVVTFLSVLGAMADEPEVPPETRCDRHDAAAIGRRARCRHHP